MILETTLTKRDDYFWVNSFELSSIFGGSWGRAVLKIGLSLNPNHHREILLAQILETYCRGI